MNTSTTTQSKTRFRPIKVVAAGLPGGPLPAASILQDPSARPAVIRTVVDPHGSGGTTKVRLIRQDEMSQAKPRMLSEQRLDRYVEKLRATKRSSSENLNQPSRIGPSVTSQRRSSATPVVTWGAPQAKQAIDLSDVDLNRPGTLHQVHSAHPNTIPHLQGWPEETVAAEAQVEAQLEQATQLDEQLRQLEIRIEKLRAKEATNSTVRSDREKEILANPNTGELVAAISTAIVSALQEKPEADVLPQAKNLFEKSLQQHAVTLDDRGGFAESSETSGQTASEAMFSSIADLRQQEQQPTNSAVSTLEQLRQRIGDYQRMMTRESATEAADLIKAHSSEIAVFESPLQAPADPPQTTVDTSNDPPQSPLVQFTAPEDAAIPLKVASWDVEDFRWSAMTNKMLNNGGDAIGNLLEVTLGRTAAKTKRVVVTGAGRGQGATTIAVSLARAANEAGYRTLLVDADVANPQLHQISGLSAKMSWINGIGSELPLGEAVIRSKKSNLCMMPLASNVERVAWPRFILDNLGEMIVNAESYFDLILIDAGPASQLLDELSSPERLMDTMVLVDSTAKLKEIEVYQNRLQTFGVDNLVLAENRKPSSAM